MRWYSAQPNLTIARDLPNYGWPPMILLSTFMHAQTVVDPISSFQSSLPNFWGLGGGGGLAKVMRTVAGFCGGGKMLTLEPIQITCVYVMKLTFGHCPMLRCSCNPLTTVLTAHTWKIFCLSISGEPIEVTLFTPLYAAKDWWMRASRPGHRQS